MPRAIIKGSSAKTVRILKSCSRMSVAFATVTFAGLATEWGLKEALERSRERTREGVLKKIAAARRELEIIKAELGPKYISRDRERDRIAAKIEEAILKLREGRI